MIYAVIDTNVLVSALIYEVSLSVDDSFLVTGNFKHYPQTPKVISPADFLKVMMDSKEE